MSVPMMDDWKFEQVGDSPVDLSGREGYDFLRCSQLGNLKHFFDSGNRIGDLIPAIQLRGLKFRNYEKFINSSQRKHGNMN